MHATGLTKHACVRIYLQLFKLVSQAKEKVEDYLRSEYGVSVDITKWFGGWNQSGKRFVFREAAPWAELDNCNVSEWYVCVCVHTCVCARALACVPRCVRVCACACVCA